MVALTAYVERTLKALRAIQSRVRMRRARSRYASERDAATRYQAAWRGRHARSDGGEQMRLAADWSAIWAIAHSRRQQHCIHAMFDLTTST